MHIIIHVVKQKKKKKYTQPYIVFVLNGILPLNDVET